MQFQLNKDKTSFLVIAGHTFTSDTPLQEIDLEKATPQEINQLIYNCRRGFMACGDPEELLAYVQQPQSNFQTPAEKPVVQTPVEAKDPIEEDLSQLRKILKGNVSSVKKVLPQLSLGRCRKLKELEVEGKNRKGLIAEMDKVISKYWDEVAAAVPGEDIAGQIHAPGVQGGSPNVSDIVESEIEEVGIAAPAGGDRVEAEEMCDGEYPTAGDEWPNTTGYSKWRK